MEDGSLKNGGGRETVRRRILSSWGLVLAAVAPLVLIFLSIWALLVFVVPTWESAKPRPDAGPRFSRELAQDLRVGLRAHPGVDLVTCGSCRVEKRTLGFFSLMAFNTLVLEDLEIVLPPSAPVRGGTTPGGGGDSRRQAAKEILNSLGVSDSFLSRDGEKLRFSGLRIQRLGVSELKEDGQVWPVFRADGAEMRSEGLALRACRVFDSGRWAPARHACLTVSNSLDLVWQDGRRRLAERATR